MKKASVEKDSQAKQVKDQVSKFKPALANLVILAKKNGLTHEELCKDLKKANSALLTIYAPAGLREYLSKVEEKELHERLIPAFLCYPVSFEQFLLSEVAATLIRCKSTLKESLALETTDEA